MIVVEQGTVKGKKGNDNIDQKSNSEQRPPHCMNRDYMDWVKHF